MFKREHHLRIATILQSLENSTLIAHECYFGGGTAITLTHEEYRESVDIDFLVSNPTGYRELRHAITGPLGIHAIVRSGSTLLLGSPIRADQYGIRTMLVIGDTEIKFEIIFEARISLEHSQDSICGVPILTPLDLATTKLLANSDRWADRGVFNRDLIDLAMLSPSPTLLKKAVHKASAAYGESIERDLRKAIDHLKTHPDRLDECILALKIDSVPKALLWKQIRRLRPR